MKITKLSVRNLFFVCALLFTATSSVFAYHGVASIDLKGLLDAAWTQSGMPPVFERRKEALIDKSELSRQLFPSSGKVSASFDSDEPFKNKGDREYKLRIQTPIWLPGQRGALSSKVAAEMDFLMANELFQRWQLAGQVRALYWQVMIARNNIKLAERKLQISKKLVWNVNKRVQAGELAEIDLLLSKQKELAAESELLSAEQKLARARLIFNGLTGVDTPEDWLSEAEKVVELESHPLLVSISRQLTLNQANIEEIRSNKRSAPSVGIGFSRGRDDRDEGYEDSVGLSFTLPLENKVLNKSNFGQAQAEKRATESRYFQEKHQLTKRIELARLAVIQAKKSFEIYERLKLLAVQHFKLMSNAFDIGEVGLRALLLVQSESDQAVENSARQRVEVARTISKLNQELGALP
jgi:cobalt-zinc-cadmium efflux system outer membrane protein